MSIRFLTSTIRALAFACVFVASSVTAEPLIRKLRATDLRWAKEQKSWERTALRLAKNPKVNLHLSKVDSAKAAYFGAVVDNGQAIEFCLLLLEGRDAKGGSSESFVLMGRTPYENTGEWEFVWKLVEPPHPKAPNIEGVLPVVWTKTKQADIWKLLEEFNACPSSQSKKRGLLAVACVIFQDTWLPFLGSPEPGKPGEEFDESKLRQSE